MLLEINLSNYLFASNMFHFVFTAFVLVYIRVALHAKTNSHTRLAFKRLLTIMTVYLVMDGLSYIFDTRTFFSAKFFSILTTTLTIFMMVIVGCAWNYFLDVVYLRDRKQSALNSAWYIIIITAAAVLLVVNLFSGWIFWVDENNVYHRGTLIYLSFAFQYAMFLVLVIRALLFNRMNKTVRYEKLKSAFAWIGIIMLCFGAFQIFAGGLIALQVFGATAGAFIMFLRFQDDQITNDMLTGLNNRYALDTYLVDKLHLYESGSHGANQLYLVMMDINYFKRINDTHGHLEGDKALKTVAKTLKKIGAKFGGALFIARFGGDEFAAVYESPSAKRVSELCLETKKTLISDSEELKYRLTIGAGYAVYTGKEMKLSELYERADRALYEDKRADGVSER